MNNQATHYTFYYCLLHDDGCCAPSGVLANPCCMNDPDAQCNIVDKGTISFDGHTITVVESVFKNYERYNGGFLFADFANTVHDSNGNRIHEHPVIDWIRAQADQSANNQAMH